MTERKITDSDIQAQKDYAFALSDELSDRLSARGEEDVVIPYLTMLEALDTVELRLAGVKNRYTNPATAAFMNAIEFDFEVPIRPRNGWNIYTCWIQERFSITQEEAIEVHNYIDDNNLLNWDELDCMEWTPVMAMAWNSALEIAEVDFLDKKKSE